MRRKTWHRILPVLLIAILLVGCSEKNNSVETIKDVAKANEAKTKAAAYVQNNLVATADPNQTAVPIDAAVITPTTDPTTTTAPEAGSDTELSDDLYSFQVMFDGVKYSLPSDYSNFVANGWIFEDANTTDLNPDTTALVSIEKGEKECYLDFLNTGIDVEKYSACKISSIEVSSFQVENEESDLIVLPKGIHIGSMEEDLKTAYGEPADIYSSDSIKQYTYETDIYASIQIEVDTTTNKVCAIEIENCYLPEADAAKIPQADDSLVPEENAKYVVPPDLGVEIPSYNVQLEGKVYTMPCPFSELAADGWSVVAESNKTVSAKGYQVGIEIQKGDKIIRTMVKNYGLKAATTKNCFITEISAYQDDKIAIVLPGNITFGTAQTEVDKIYDSVSGEKRKENNEGGTFQSVYYTFGSLDCVTIVCTDGVVTNIEVSRSPIDIPY